MGISKGLVEMFEVDFADKISAHVDGGGNQLRV